MLRQCACVGLMLALAACTPGRIVLDDNTATTPPESPDAAMAVTDTAAPGPDMAFGRDGGMTCTARLAGSQSITIALDRSSNMQQAFPGSASKLAAVQSVLGDWTNSPHIQLDMVRFPGDPSDGSCAGTTCCASNVSFGTDPLNWGASSSKDSPSHKALANVADAYRRGRPPTSVILLTSSDPSCATDPSHPAGDPCTAAQSAVKDLSQAAIPIPVIVVSLGGNLPCLSKTSTTSLPDNVQKFYQPASRDELSKDIQDIFGAIQKGACDLYPVLGNNNGPGSYYGSRPLKVTLNNTDLKENDPNGYSIGNFGTINLAGSACTLYLAAQSPDAAQATYPYYYHSYSSPFDGGRGGNCGGPQ